MRGIESVNPGAGLDAERNYRQRRVCDWFGVEGCRAEKSEGTRCGVGGKQSEWLGFGWRLDGVAGGWWKGLAWRRSTPPR